MDGWVYIETTMLGNSGWLDVVKVDFNKASLKHAHTTGMGDQRAAPTNRGHL